MTEPVVPKYQWGQRVHAVLDLYNDGSFPECPADALLVKTGDAGEIVQVGTHVESNTTIYLVEFKPNRVVGCREEEIAPVSPQAQRTTQPGAEGNLGESGAPDLAPGAVR